MDEDEQRVGQDVDVGERDEHPREDREHEERTAHGEDRFVGVAVGDPAPGPVEDDVHDLAPDAEGDDDRYVEAYPLQHVDREERRGKVDGEVPRAEEYDEVLEVDVRKRLFDGGKQAVLLVGGNHPGLGRAGKEGDAEEAGDEPEEEEGGVAVGRKVRKDGLPGVDEEPGGEADDERKRRREGQPPGEEGPEPVLGYQVPHPGVPTAMRDCRERCVEGDRRDENEDSLLRREEERYQDDGQPAEAGGKRGRDDHQPPFLDPVDDVDSGHLQEFGKRRYGGKQPDDGVGCPELEGEGYEEDAAGQGHHCLGGKAVPDDEFQTAPDLLVRQALFCLKDHGFPDILFLCSRDSSPRRAGRRRACRDSGTAADPAPGALF